MLQVYRDERSMAHLWAGLAYFEAGELSSAESEFASACELSSSLVCERATPNDIVCPSPIMGETANLTRDVSAGEVLDEEMVVLGCNINPGESLNRDEIQSYFGREVVEDLKRGKPLPKTSLKRPN